MILIAIIFQSQNPRFLSAENLVNLLGIPSSLNFAVMGSVILIGVLADQQISRRSARVRSPAS